MRVKPTYPISVMMSRQHRTSRQHQPLHQEITTTRALQTILILGTRFAGLIGAESKLGHSDSCEGKICGFLNLEVKKSNEYVIVSPRVPAKPYPYNMETLAKIRSSRQDGDSYGIIFGASTNGQKCPVDDFSTCFNHYYEMRARYRDSGGKQWIEFKLVRVEGHDANNQPLELS